MEAKLENIDELKKKLYDNIRTINFYLESYMKKALDPVRSTSKARDTLAYRKECYKDKKLLEKLNSYTNELLLDMKEENLLAIEIITVPFLPEIDDELQMQFEMVFLDGSSPWHFLLGHTQKDTATKLNNLLKERLTNLEELDESPNPGDYVFFKRTNKLVRGFVHLIDAESRYHILDIDRGTIIKTKLKRLFKMDAEISLIPQQALKCTLIKDSKDYSVWTEESKELFLSSIKKCKLTVKIIGFNQDYPPRFHVELKAQKKEEDTENTVDVGKWVTDRITPALKSGRSLSALDMFSIQDDEKDNGSETLSQKSQTSPTIEPAHDDDGREVGSIKDEKICPEIVAVSTPPASMTNAQNSNHGQSCAADEIKVPTSAANSNEYPRSDDTVTQTTNVISVNNPALSFLQNIHLMNLMTGYPPIPVLPNGMPFMGYPSNMNCLFPPLPMQVSGYPAANQSLGNESSRSTTDLPSPPSYPAANQSLGSANSRSTTDFKPNQAVTPNQELNPTANNYFGETNRLDHVNDRNNTLMATSGCIPIDEERICSFYRETGRCPKLGCRQIHKFMGKDVSAIDKTEAYTRRKLPGEGRIVKIKVLHNGCLSPTRFYGHWEFINDAEKNRKIARRSYVTYMHTNQECVEYSGGEDDECTEETLDTLMTALNEPYKTYHYQHLNVLPLIGELVIAIKIPKDGKFVCLRAKVCDVQRYGEKLCDVFLVDYGETNRIPLRDLRRMEPRFLRLPPQATQFCIAGVEELKEKWGPYEPPASIISQWENKTLYGTVTKRHNDDDYVEVDLKDENGQSIRDKLHQTGKYRRVAIDVESQSRG